MSKQINTLKPGVYTCDECVAELEESVDFPIVGQDVRGVCSIHPENQNFTLVAQINTFSDQLLDTVNLHPQQLPENTDEVVLVMPGQEQVS